MVKERPMEASDMLQQFSDSLLNHVLEVADQLANDLFTRMAKNIQKEYLFHGA